jgi:hypothetical protein
MDPDDLRMLRPWRLRGAALLLLVVLAGLREAPTVRPPAPAPPDRFLEASGEQAKKKPKACDPPCQKPQVCADGTCALPASRPAHLPGEPHSDAQMTWVLDSLW